MMLISLGHSSYKMNRIIKRTEFRIPYSDPKKSVKNQKIDKLLADYINKCDSISESNKPRYKKYQHYIALTFAYYKEKPSAKFMKSELNYIKNRLLKLTKKSEYSIEFNDPIRIEDVYDEYQTNVILGLLGLDIIEE